jgi:predicted nucleotidyltransferase
MNPNDPNIAMVESVIDLLGEMAERFVFVGGCAAGLLITDEARQTVRATKDVDLIVEVLSLAGYYELHKELKQLGLKEDLDVTCRWHSGNLKLDVMPTVEGVLGFTNSWYRHAVQQARRFRLPSGADIRLVSPPMFIATKLEAFRGRGKGDFGASTDMEDIVAVIDGRHELVNEILASSAEVRDYIADEFDSLLGNERFIETLGWHLASDVANQSRVSEIIVRMRTIVGI